MDAGIRQRLVGAAVVIALAVIFLPLLFDFRDGGDGSEIDRRQPEPPDTAAAGYEDLPVDPRGAPTPQLPEPEPEPSPDLAAEPAPAPMPTEPAQPEPLPAEPAPAPPALAMDVPPESTLPAPAPPVQPPPVPAAGGGRFSVVYGSFRNRANADEVKAQLALNLGIETRIEPISSGDRQLFRVRSDGHASRADAEAERLRALAQIANLSASVSGTALPSAEAPLRPTSERNPAAHAVQLGVFGTSAAAQQLADQLRGQRYNAYVETVRLAAGTRYRVRVGPYTRRADADRIREQLRSRHRDAQVVPHP